MIVRKMKRWIALAWMAAILLQGYAFNVTALDVEVTEAVSEISDIAAVSETTPNYFYDSEVSTYIITVY